MKWGMLKENNHFKSTTTISPTKHIPKQLTQQKKTTQFNKIYARREILNS